MKLSIKLLGFALAIIAFTNIDANAQGLRDRREDVRDRREDVRDKKKIEKIKSKTYVTAVKMCVIQKKTLEMPNTMAEEKTA